MRFLRLQVQGQQVNLSFPWGGRNNGIYSLSTAASLAELRTSLKRLYIHDCAFYVYRPKMREHFRAAETTTLQDLLTGRWILQLDGTSYHCYSDPCQLITTSNISRFIQSVLPEKIEEKLASIHTDVSSQEGEEGVQSTLTPTHISEIVNELAMSRAAVWRHKEERLDNAIAQLETQISHLQLTQSTILTAGNKSGKRGLITFTSWLALQFVCVQYGTYVAYSWDIMEPITCLLGLGDATIAYWFWMRSGLDYDRAGIANYWSGRKVAKMYKKIKFDPTLVEVLQSDVQKLQEFKRWVRGDAF